MDKKSHFLYPIFLKNSFPSIFPKFPFPDSFSLNSFFSLSFLFSSTLRFRLSSLNRAPCITGCHSTVGGSAMLSGTKQKTSRVQHLLLFLSKMASIKETSSSSPAAQHTSKAMLSSSPQKPVIPSSIASFTNSRALQKATIILTNYPLSTISKKKCSSEKHPCAFRCLDGSNSSSSSLSSQHISVAFVMRYNFPHYPIPQV